MTVAPSDELTHYLAAKHNDLKDKEVLGWWEDHQAKYPHLAVMTLSYLTAPDTSFPSLFLSLLLTAPPFPGPSVFVERTFSRGHLVLPHVCNRLSAESTRAVLCLEEWSCLGLVSDKDMLFVTSGGEADEDALEENWEDLLKGTASLSL